MKINYSFLLFLFIALFFTPSCKEYARIMKVTTDNISKETATGAIANATIIDVGETGVDEFGWCWSTTSEPTIEDTKMSFGKKNEAGSQSTLISGLNPEQKYYLKPYLLGNNNIVYGEASEISTLALDFKINLPHESNIVAKTKPFIIEWRANVSDNLKIELYQHNTLLNTIVEDIENTGTYTWAIDSSLADGDDYKIKIVSVLNNEVFAQSGTFSIYSEAPPAVETLEISNLSYFTATVEGNIQNFGTDSSAIQYGHCWSTSPNPSILDNKTELGTTSSPGSYTSSLTNLKDSTVYYVRAYATNSIGTAYGDEKTFTTLDAKVPSLTTSAVADISYFTATSGGNISSEGTHAVTARGVCWSTSSNPTLADNKTIDGTGIGGFTSGLTGLIDNTVYHVRAYATNSAATAYGDEQSFTTLDAKEPSLTTSAVTDISYFTANSGGNISNDNGFAVTARGVCWSTSPNPTIADNKTNDGTGIGSFTSNLTNLTDSTVYYVRSYATNSVGTGYGAEQTFTTLDAKEPSLTTATVTNISYFTASSGGDISSDNGFVITARGVSWSTSPNPTIADNKTIDGTGIGSFKSNLTSLTNNTVYYVRAYAINSVGIAYGNEITFITSEVAKPSLTTSSVTDISYFTANSGGDISSDNGSAVTSRGVCWSTSSNPTIADNKTNDGAGIGSYTSSLTGLTDNTVYYVRAYATNSVGTSYGVQKKFTTFNSGFPIVSIDSVSNVSYFVASVYGKLESQGTYPVSARGICWSKNHNPNINDNKTNDGAILGSFSGLLLSLEDNTVYYARVYATSDAGTSYSPELMFTTKQTGILYDYDGNKYKTVVIGNQTWMAENLKVSHYSDGVTAGYLVYNNNVNGEKDIYGALYSGSVTTNNVYSSSNPSGVRGICPVGWHVPSNGEWFELESFLGGSSIAGAKLKEVGTEHWVNTVSGTTNESGFTALPGGVGAYSSYHFSYGNIGSTGFWWSSDNYCHYIRSQGSEIWSSSASTGSYYSVRCVKD